MDSKSTTSHAGNSKATGAYSAFILASIILTINYLIFSPVAEARWYDPERGTFISRDPALNYNPEVFPEYPSAALASGNSKDLHPYSFCYNDPVNFVDQDGKHPAAVLLLKVIVAGVVLWLTAEQYKAYLDNAIIAKATAGCAGQTANKNYLGTGGSKPPLPNFVPRPGAPKSCNDVLIRAKAALESGGNEAIGAAANLIRFWNDNCAPAGGKL